MPNITMYWRGWNESNLAAFQQDQGNSNHCAKFASASAVNLLTGSAIDGNSLVAWLENRLLQGSARYTIFGNDNGSLVFQTANQLRRTGSFAGIDLDIRIKRGKVPDLLDELKDGESVCLVTLTYFQGEEPLIAKGQNTANALAPARWIGGHIMILAAYDAKHQNRVGLPTPWGFLSSWGCTDELYWMADMDFQRTWGRLSFFNMITARRN